MEGLSESMSKLWSGDVDLADGELQKSYEAYRKRLNFIGTVGLPPKNSRGEIADTLQLIKANLNDDLDSVATGEINNSYPSTYTHTHTHL